MKNKTSTIRDIIVLALIIIITIFITLYASKASAQGFLITWQPNPPEEQIDGKVIEVKS